MHSELALDEVQMFKPRLIELCVCETADELRGCRGTEVPAGVRAPMRAATIDIADEVTTPFRAWSAYTHLFGPQVRPLVLFINRGLRLRCARDNRRTVADEQG